MPPPADALVSFSVGLPGWSGPEPTHGCGAGSLARCFRELPSAVSRGPLLPKSRCAPASCSAQRAATTPHRACPVSTDTGLEEMTARGAVAVPFPGRHAGWAINRRALELIAANVDTWVSIEKAPSALACVRALEAVPRRLTAGVLRRRDASRGRVRVWHAAAHAQHPLRGVEHLCRPQRACNTACHRPRRGCCAASRPAESVRHEPVVVSVLSLSLSASTAMTSLHCIPLRPTACAPSSSSALVAVIGVRQLRGSRGH
jgi:hypothetical protein